MEDEGTELMGMTHSERSDPNDIGPQNATGASGSGDRSIEDALRIIEGAVDVSGINRVRRSDLSTILDDNDIYWYKGLFGIGDIHDLPNAPEAEGRIKAIYDHSTSQHWIVRANGGGVLTEEASGHRDLMGNIVLTSLEGEDRLGSMWYRDWGDLIWLTRLRQIAREHAKEHGREMVSPEDVGWSTAPLTQWGREGAICSPGLPVLRAAEKVTGLSNRRLLHLAEIHGETAIHWIRGEGNCVYRAVWIALISAPGSPDIQVGKRGDWSMLFRLS